MWISVTFVNGPLEGTVEFDEDDPGKPEFDEISQAKNFYARTQGEVGRGFNGTLQQARSLTNWPVSSASERARSVLYRVEACEERDGVRYVRAQLFPK